MSDRRTFLKQAGLGAAGAAVPATPPPTARLHLQTVTVAGFRHHAGMRPEVADGLRPGRALEIRPEPDNPHDPNALAVYADGARLGYLPRFENEVAAELARQAATLSADVVAFEPSAASWERLTVAVFLQP